MGNRELGMGNRELGMGHRELGMGHWLLPDRARRISRALFSFFTRILLILPLSIESQHQCKINSCCPTLLASWVWQLRSRFVEPQKNQADQFNLAILSLIQKIPQANTLDEIDLLQEELFEIFQQVIVDLDQDRIDSDSFQSFTFTWETAMKIAGDREKMLRELRLFSDS